MPRTIMRVRRRAMKCSRCRKEYPDGFPKVCSRCVAYNREQRERQVRSGLCHQPGCREPPEAGRKLCVRHTVMGRARCVEYRARKLGLRLPAESDLDDFDSVL